MSQAMREEINKASKRVLEDCAFTKHLISDEEVVDYSHEVTSVVCNRLGDTVARLGYGRTAAFIRKYKDGCWSSWGGTLIPGARGFTAAAFSKLGDKIVTVEFDLVKVWIPRHNDHASSDWCVELELQCPDAVRAEVNAAGDKIVTALRDGTVHVWTLDNFNGHCEATLKGHKDCVNSIECSESGNRIVTASKDGTARVWILDGKKWRCEQALEHGGEVHFATFNGSGNRIVTASNDKAAHVWILEGK